jgi:hypothetical protein
MRLSSLAASVDVCDAPDTRLTAAIPVTSVSNTLDIMTFWLENTSLLDGGCSVDVE